MYRKNTAGQFICVQLILTATGAPATGLAPAARSCIDGTFAAGGGTYTEDGTTGSYKYAMSQGDTNGNDISIITSATGAIPVCVNFVTTAANPTDTVRFGLTALPNAAANAAGGLPISSAGALDLDEMNADVELIQTSTSSLTYTVANQVDVNVLDWKSATAPAMTGDAFARLGAPVGASISADIAEIEGETDAIQTSTAGLTFTVANQVDCNPLSINGSSVAAATLAENLEDCPRGVCSGGTTTTAICSSIANPASLTDAGQLIGRTIIFDADTATANLQSQASNITASTTGATPTITFTALTHAPANTDTFSVV